MTRNPWNAMARRRDKREALRARAAGDRVHALLQQARGQEAGDALFAVLAKIRSPLARADLLREVASWELAHGTRSPLARESHAADLLVADECLSAGDYGETASLIIVAMRTAFHQVLHFDGMTSPLAAEPVSFTAPLRDSAVGKALRGYDGHRFPSHEAAQPALYRDGRTKLMIATQHNDDFLNEIRDHFAEPDGFDTRFEFFKDTPAINRFGKHPQRLVEQVLAQKPGLPRALENTFREHLDWADVVFVEWATALAALISRIDHPGTRVVVRLHSFEAFSMWPHMTVWSNIDDVVFVSEHLRDFALKAIPGLSEPGAPRLHVIPNAMDLAKFVRPKEDEARFTLAVVGASKIVKDPRWAIDVVRHLRKHDERYRLLLIRSKFQDTSAATHEYAEALEQDLAELEPAGAVVPMKHTDDVPAALQEVGVVISSSVRESFHMGLVEGVASGALPVVRDWPFFPGAARKLFPEDWVVDTPEQAAERILALTQDVDTWRAETRAAAQHVIEKWDWTVVRGDFERLFKSGPSSL